MTQFNLFSEAEVPETPRNEVFFRPVRSRVWTENKAKLIALYLKYFVYITKHGCYIDGFAGPKNPDNLDSCAAKLVLESRPAFLREFFLCDADKAKIDLLRNIVSGEENVPGRRIEILEGDFNESYKLILESGAIRESTATFCLLDQFSTECHWSTVEALARHKREGAKIELFYFFPTGWLERTLSALKGDITPLRWWGKEWPELLKIFGMNRTLYVCNRFKSELGYRHAHPWPIFHNGRRGRVMFHMIHATDHDEAPKLMWRAYHKATLPPETNEQLALPLARFSPLASSYGVDS